MESKAKISEIVKDGSSFSNRDDGVGRTITPKTASYSAAYHDTYLNMKNNNNEVFTVNFGPKAETVMLSATEVVQKKGREIKTSKFIDGNLLLVGTPAQLDSLVIKKDDDNNILLSTADGKKATLPPGIMFGVITGKKLKMEDGSSIPEIGSYEAVDVIIAKQAAAQVAPIPPMPKSEDKAPGEGSPPMPEQAQRKR